MDKQERDQIGIKIKSRLLRLSKTEGELFTLGVKTAYKELMNLLSEKDLSKKELRIFLMHTINFLQNRNY